MLPAELLHEWGVVQRVIHRAVVEAESLGDLLRLDAVAAADGGTDRAVGLIGLVDRVIHISQCQKLVRQSGIALMTGSS